MSDAIVVLNAGSSSLKFSVFLIESRECKLLLRGQVERLRGAPCFAAEGVHAGCGQKLAAVVGACGDEEDGLGGPDSFQSLWFSTWEQASSLLQPSVALPLGWYPTRRSWLSSVASQSPPPCSCSCR